MVWTRPSAGKLSTFNGVLEKGKVRHAWGHIPTRGTGKVAIDIFDDVATITVTNRRGMSCAAIDKELLAALACWVVENQSQVGDKPHG